MFKTFIIHWTDVETCILKLGVENGTALYLVIIKSNTEIGIFFTCCMWICLLVLYIQFMFLPLFLPLTTDVSCQSESWRVNGIKRSVPEVTKLSDTCQASPCWNMNRHADTAARTLNCNHAVHSLHAYSNRLHKLRNISAFHFFTFCRPIVCSITQFPHSELLFHPLLSQMKIFTNTPRMKGYL